MSGLAQDSSLAPAGAPPAPLTETMVIAWWNIGPFPRDRSKTGDAKGNAILEVVRYLIDTLAVDLLTLGEVTRDDLLALKAGCAKPTLSLYDGTTKNGRLQFDTGVLYDRERLEILNEQTLVHSHYDRRLKLANQLRFLIEYDKSAFDIFITHWPSRGITQENVPVRKALAGQLGTKLAEIKRDLGRYPVIVLGDFNDEPFDESLVTGLLATRDRTLAASGDYLYNPFWRHVGESALYSMSLNFEGFGGTHFHGEGTETHWRTFDQILFSSSFLGYGEWHLDEYRTGPFVPQCTFDFGRKSAMFDHLPVLGVIQRASKGVEL